MKMNVTAHSTDSQVPQFDKQRHFLWYLNILNIQYFALSDLRQVYTNGKAMKAIFVLNTILP